MYIHYGHKHFLKRKFQEVKNINWLKPLGGLWASDINAEYGWKQWCDDNNFRECSKDDAFCFELTENANVLHIRNVNDLKDLPVTTFESGIKLINMHSIDFEKMRTDGVDAIELHLSDDWRLYWELYGWDCDSILIINPDVVKEC